MIYSCPVCNGVLRSGYWLTQNKELVTPLKRSVMARMPFYAEVRVRVCETCGHLDYYIDESQLSDFLSTPTDYQNK